MASTYSKPFLPFADQLSLLENRGLTVEDRDAALHHLQTVGYYTLGGYLYPMREIVTVAGEQTRSDQFRAGASFKHVIDLYNFDQQLRLLCLEALERIERVVKVQVAYQSGLRDPFAHDTGSLHSRDRLAVKPGEALSALSTFK
jgi:abortive infection bacteriophage resistance protein